MDGRDIGTVVMPDADYKFFLIVDEAEAAKRRYKELLEKDKNVSYEEVLNNIRHRNKIDSGRSYNPLAKPKDALLIDTTNLSVKEIVDKIYHIIVENENKKTS